MSVTRFVKTNIFEISLSLCFLLPPIGILFLIILSFLTIYQTLKANNRFNFSLTSIFLICLFISTLGAVIQMQDLSLLVGSLMVLSYWGIFQKVVLNNNENKFKHYRWIVIFGGIYNCLLAPVNKWAVTHPVVGYLTGTGLIGDTPAANYSRLVGSAYNPNFTMFLLLLSMTFVFVEVLARIRNKQYSLLNVLIPFLLILSIGVIETGSRAGYIAMFCIYMLFFVRLNKFVFIFGTIAALCFKKPLFNLMPRNTSIGYSYEGRQQIWMNSFKIWDEHPLFGTTSFGYRTEYFKMFNQDMPHAHNIFIGFLTEYGMLGEISFLTLFAAIFYKCTKLFFVKKNNNEKLDCFLLSLPIVIFTGILDEPTYAPQIALLTIVLLGYWETHLISLRYLNTTYLEEKISGLKKVS